LAYFWALNYLVVWNQTLRDIADAHVHKIGDSARLFALEFCDRRLCNHFMGQQSALRFLASRHGYPRGRQRWQPAHRGPTELAAACQHSKLSDNTSGANNVTGAVTRILQLFFGRDKLTFSVTTTNPLAVQQTRTYYRFSDAASDVVNARIHEGIHFRFADTAARRQGRQVAYERLARSHVRFG
jgi:hypothetical protein